MEVHILSGAIYPLIVSLFWPRVARTTGVRHRSIVYYCIDTVHRQYSEVNIVLELSTLSGIGSTLLVPSVPTRQGIINTIVHGQQNCGQTSSNQLDGTDTQTNRQRSAN